MRKLGLAVVALLVLAGPTVQAFDETGAHSVLKHDLIDTIVFEAKVDRVVDLFGGQIVYYNARTKQSEVGAAGRIIMNGHTGRYVINDRDYSKRAQIPRHCLVKGLPDEAQDVAVTVKATDFNENRFVEEAIKFLSELPRIEGKQIMLIDPYFFTFADTVQGILDNTSTNTALLIYSPRNRVVDKPFPKPCRSFVYSETTDNFKSILKNTKGQELTYTLTGCRLNPAEWNKGIAATLRQFGTNVMPTDTGALIRASAPPPDFGHYLPGAKEVRACIIDGGGPFAETK